MICPSGATMSVAVRLVVCVVGAVLLPSSRVCLTCVGCLPCFECGQMSMDGSEFCEGSCRFCCNVGVGRNHIFYCFSVLNSSLR